MPPAAVQQASCSHASDLQCSFHRSCRTPKLPRIRQRACPRLLLPRLRSNLAFIVKATETQPDGSVVKSSSQSTSAASGSNSTSPTKETIFSKRAVLRQLLVCSSAAEVLDVLLQNEELCSQTSVIPPADCEVLVLAALERGNIPLALSVYKELCLQRQPFPSTSTAIAGITWPKITIEITRSTILGLARATEVEQAKNVLQSCITRGVPQSKDLDFGVIVPSPMNPSKPLTVVQPREGVKNVGDALSRYEYEVFSGAVTSSTTEALNVTPNPILAAAIALGIWKRPQVQAIHEFVVQAPSGTSRAFRFGTATADIPANTGERVSVVCSPTQGTNKYRNAFFSSNQPGTNPGQPLLITNHLTNISTQLLKPPASNKQAGIPSWVLPTAILLAGSDAATGLLDPTLPVMIATSVAITAGSAVAGQTFLLPELKRIPSPRLKAQSHRQTLLQQHSSLASKCNAVLEEANETVYYLAQIWQLMRKMSVVTNSRAYEARTERLSRIRTDLEQRISKQLELLDGYSDVIRKIEIEIELEEQLDMANDELEREIARLEELASLKEEWTFQSEAADEVERLLRTAS